MNEHIHFWENEAEREYDRLEKFFCESDFAGSWPQAINFECTTFCNAKCQNCSHDSLIKTGQRLNKSVSLDKIKYYIKKIKLFTLFHKIDDPLVLPVGLGEPLCHPNMIEILRYIEVFFKRISFTSNANLLSTGIADQLSKINLESITLSLSYFDEKIYEEQCGLNYKRTIQNIEYYLKKRKENNSSGFAVIHIFDNNLNSEATRVAFEERFKPYIREGDILNLRQYYEFTNIENVKSKLKRRKLLKPCYQLWSQLTVDVDGNMFPCCIAVWKKKSDYLLLGNLEFSTYDEITKNLMNLRKMQFEGIFEECKFCETLYHNESFWLPYFLYDKEESICGDIKYRIMPGLCKRMEKYVLRINKHVIS